MASTKNINAWQVAAIVFFVATLLLAARLQMTRSTELENTIYTSGKYKFSAPRENLDGEEKITLMVATHFDDIPRLLASMGALRLNMPDWAVHEMIMVTPYAESLVLPTFLSPPSGYTSSWPIRVIPEHKVLGVPLKMLTSFEDFDMKYFKYKMQMALKLFVVRHIATNYYLVLDSDVIMMKPLETIRWLFPKPGVGIYNPEPRWIHELWWNQTESYFNLSCPDAMMGVTPALLNRVLVEQTIEHIFSLFGSDPKDWLYALVSTHTPFWTEYTAYRLVGCLKGNFWKYHMEQLPKSKDFPDGTPHLYGGCWTSSETLNQTIGLSDNSLFLVVQSNTNVPVRKVVEDVKDVFLLPGVQQS